jgi:cobalt-zinc-cadmium efflux system membrane fusion protein
VRFESPEALERTGIETAAVEKRPMYQVVTAAGAIDYDRARLAHLSPRTGGHVWKIYKRLGDPVQHGQVLGLVDAAEVGRGKAEFLQALVTFNLRTSTLENARKAWRTGALPERTYLEQQTALGEARIRLANAHQALANLGLAIRLEDFVSVPPEQLTVRVRLAGLPPSVTEALAKDVATANLLPLIAPFDGVVTRCDVADGEMVAPDKPVFVVADVRHMWVMLDVREEDAGRLKLGQHVIFRPDAGGVEAGGAIAWIATEVDGKTHTVKARAEVDNASSQLRAGGFGTGRVVVAERPDALAVPTAAIQWNGSSALVFVRQEDGLSFRPRRVRTGLNDASHTELAEGVRPGEIVATQGSHVLKSELFERAAGSEKE